MSGRIFCSTHAEKITDGAKGCTVTSKDGFNVECRAVVEATNIPITNRISIIDKCMPYRSYVIAGYIPKGDACLFSQQIRCALTSLCFCSAGSVPTCLVWDCADPYHYVRTSSDVNDPTSNRELLIVGGEDHKVRIDCIDCVHMLQTRGGQVLSHEFIVLACAGWVRRGRTRP